MLKYPNILTISGEGQNVGKTLLACNIIAKFAREYDIVGLKITPHKHKDTGNARVLFIQGKSIIMEETNPMSRKDTGRMLAAGAVKSFLMQTTDIELQDALASFIAQLGKKSMIVCESGKLGSLNQTGINFYVRLLNCQVYDIEKKLPTACIDRIVTYAVNGFDIDLNTITISNNSWKLKED